MSSEGYIYVASVPEIIGAQDVSGVKVGQTTYPARREKQLQFFYGDLLKIEAVWLVDDALKAERDAHAALKEHKAVWRGPVAMNPLREIFCCDAEQAISILEAIFESEPRRADIGSQFVDLRPRRQKKTRLQLHIDPAQADWLRRRAETEQRTVSATVRKMLDDLIAVEAPQASHH